MELMCIPSPSISHLIPMVELAKLLTERDDRLTIKVFIMKQPSDSKVSAFIESHNSSSISNRIQFIDLPSEDEPTTSFDFFSFIESKKPQLKHVLSKLTLVESSSNTSRVAAVVLDMFCTPMIDVANEFGIPTYIYYTSGANFLGLIFHIQALHDEHNQDIVAYKDSDTDLVVPSFVNKVPAKWCSYALVAWEVLKKTKLIKEIAYALEHSGCRFLWSLRKPPPSGGIASPSDYTNLEEILPQGFIERTQGIGKVIGWAPQVAILGHSAIGGFVSHCGWNSMLESLWFGVPIAAWPMYAEQQINAFEMMKELGLAVEVKMDYDNSK
ncbi:hypothetical protein SO802_010159 [Lithocarpus litseifolius]|uniref:Uncharacterized protein n=1 Tax=Lithocarpus litseifolius TaxID=425828 RepID=A0AAW2DFR6_9ROSI